VILGDRSWGFVQAMRSPSILSQCLAGFLSHEKAAAHCVNVVPERESHPPSPAVEIVPSKNVHPYKYAGENIEMHGMNIFKGKVSVVDIVGLSGSEVITPKGEGKCHTPNDNHFVLTT
jgi:hypothetical protein